MRILHVITGLPKAAGTSTFCGEVCNQLAALGHDVTIAVLNPSAPDHYLLDSRVHLISISSLLTSHPSPLTPHLVHIHGLWSPILHRVSCWAHARSIPVVWSTHGMTAPWALKHKWWKKFLPWHLYQKRDLKRAQLIHCTSDFEVEWNRAIGLGKTFLAPLGTFLPEAKEVVGESCSCRAEGANILNAETPTTNYNSRSKTLLFVGRIYPVKALDRLIEAFALALRQSNNPTIQQSNNSPWILRLVGPDQAGHMAELMSLCDRLNLSYSTPDQSNNPTIKQSNISLVEFVGPKFGPDLDREYATCDALALVSHTENFGATVIDALAHGKPVVTSTRTPWSVVQGNSNNSTIQQSSNSSRCGWWVDNDVETLAVALSELLNLSTSELSRLGANGRKLVEERFTWEAVARTVQKAYETCENQVSQV